MDTLNVLVVEDTLTYRKILSEAVKRTGMGHAGYTASNGMIALERLKHYAADVVLMDVFMPEMDGINTLKMIKKSFPHVQVIMISSGGSDSAAMTLEALKLGAMDFIIKPSDMDPQKNMEKIKNHLKMLFAQIQMKKYQPTESSKNRVEHKNVRADLPFPDALDAVPDKQETPLRSGIDLVLIASSTGGPNALEEVLMGLPANFNKPILVVQHMPRNFTKIMAQSLDKKCKLRVVEGEHGMPVKNSEVIIAPGGFHMTVAASASREKVIQLESTPYVNGVRPAADVLFHSVAKVYKNHRILTIVLTGMGCDGLAGVRKLKENCRCFCITQSENTCVVYGMPRSVYEAGLSDQSTDLTDMAGHIQQIASGS